MLEKQMILCITIDFVKIFPNENVASFRFRMGMALKKHVERELVSQKFELYLFPSLNVASSMKYDEPTECHRRFHIFAHILSIYLLENYNVFDNIACRLVSCKRKLP